MLVLVLALNSLSESLIFDSSHLYGLALILPANGLLSRSITRIFFAQVNGKLACLFGAFHDLLNLVTSFDEIRDLINSSIIVEITNRVKHFDQVNGEFACLSSREYLV